MVSINKYVAVEASILEMVSTDSKSKCSMFPFMMMHCTHFRCVICRQQILLSILFHTWFYVRIGSVCSIKRNPHISINRFHFTDCAFDIDRGLVEYIFEIQVLTGFRIRANTCHPTTSEHANFVDTDVVAFPKPA